MRKTHPIRLVCNKRAVSIVISTLIISAAILVVTAIASFLGMNVLELQSQQAEFEQAKTNMQILGAIIDDTGVKPGAGSFVRFNERTGGLGYVIDNRPITLTFNVTGTIMDQTVLTNSLMNITYRGGKLVNTFDSTIKGRDNLTVSGLATPLWLLKQKQANGAWLNLDYNRVRIVDAGNITVGSNQYHVVVVTFFNLTHGEFQGSGNLDVKVQNTGINPPILFGPYNTDNTPKNNCIIVSCGSVTDPDPYRLPINTKGVIVMVNVSNLELSTL